MTSTDFCRTRGILSHGRKKNGEDHHTHCGRPSSNPRKRAVLSLLLPQGCLFKGNKEKKTYALVKADYVYFIYCYYFFDKPFIYI